MFKHVLATVLSALTLFFSAHVNAKGINDIPHRDRDFRCVDERAARKYVDDFNININSFGGFERCNNAIDTKRLFNDLNIIENGQFAGKARNAFVQGFVNKNDYYGWLKRNTRGVRRDRQHSWATAYNSGGYFTMLNGWANLSTLGRVGTIIHEARHTEGYRHLRCTHGPYNRSWASGCDTSVAQGGSHGVEMEYYSRVVLQGTNFHPVYKSMARLMALGRGNFVFNEMPIRKQHALLLVDSESGDIELYDGRTNLRRIAPAIGGQVVKATSYGAALYNPENGYARAIDLYSTAQGRAPMQDDFSYYKMMRIREFTRDFVDVEEIDLQGTRWMVGYTNRNEVKSYFFPRGQWRTPRTVNENIARLVRTNRSGQLGAFFIGESGRMYEFDPVEDSLRETGETWNEQVRSYVRFGSKTLALGTDNVVYEVAKNGGLSEYAGLSGRTFSQIVKVPLYDAFAVGQ